MFKGSGFYCTDNTRGNRYDSGKSEKEPAKKDADTAAKKEPDKKGGNGNSPESTKSTSATAEKN